MRMLQGQLGLLVCALLPCFGRGNPAKTDVQNTCLEDDITLLQTGATVTERVDLATKEKIPIQQGIIHHRYALLAAKTSGVLEQKLPTLVKCTDAHGALGADKCIDVNGRACKLCGQPSSMFPEYADGFIVRDDCGNQSEAEDLDRRLVTYNNPPSPNFLPPKAGSPTSWTNAWCELNLQKSCADADANRDYFYYVAGYVVPPGFEYDFYYCKHNGFLGEAFVKNMRNYDMLYEQAAAVCAARDSEFNVSSITHRQMGEVYRPELGPPSPEQARWLGAWACAMGGPGGDIAYCAYTFKDLGDGNFCQYPSGPGFKGTLYEGSRLAKQWECPKES